MRLSARILLLLAISAGRIHAGIGPDQGRDGRDPGGKPASGILLDHVRDVDARLRVVGGYGDSRFNNHRRAGYPRTAVCGGRAGAVSALARRAQPVRRKLSVPKVRFRRSRCG